jgi:hypothetical protein
MVAPQPLTCEQISHLSESELLAYFLDNCRYDKENAQHPYFIRFGAKHYRHKDTQKLLAIFKKVVCDYRKGQQTG